MKAPLSFCMSVLPTLTSFPLLFLLQSPAPTTVPSAHLGRAPRSPPQSPAPRRVLLSPPFPMLHLPPPCSLSSCPRASRSLPPSPCTRPRSKSSGWIINAFFDIAHNLMIILRSGDAGATQLADAPQRPSVPNPSCATGLES